MRPRKGQSLLELVAVITMVTVGIFFAGPTVIRGINAHFKIWDDSIQDSYSDPMVKAPPLLNNELSTTCDVSAWQGDIQRCGTSPCLPTEYLQTRMCNPAGCCQASGQTCTSSAGIRCISAVERCVDSSVCCDLYVDTPRCGEGAVSQTPPGNCLLNNRVTQRRCGTGLNQYGCRFDDRIDDGNPSCVPQCLGQYTTAANPQPFMPIICPGDDVPPLVPPASGWIQNANGIGININFVSDPYLANNYCNHPPTPLPNQSCEVYCVAPYFLNAARSACINGTMFSVAPLNDHCAQSSSGCTCTRTGSGGSGPRTSTMSCRPWGGSNQFCVSFPVAGVNVRSSDGSTGTTASCRIGTPASGSTPGAGCTLTVW